VEPSRSRTERPEYVLGGSVYTSLHSTPLRSTDHLLYIQPTIYSILFPRPPKKNAFRETLLQAKQKQYVSQTVSSSRLISVGLNSKTRDLCKIVSGMSSSQIWGRTRSFAPTQSRTYTLISRLPVPVPAISASAIIVKRGWVNGAKKITLLEPGNTEHANRRRCGHGYTSTEL